MKKVYTSTNLIECSFRRTILESQGIRCMIKNELLSPLAGGIPAPEVWPELWILDDERIEEAIQLLDAEEQDEGSLTESE
ncbi:MAG: DUF2007 domain-containing protein [Candidatus Eisenbacteria bacterium]